MLEPIFTALKYKIPVDINTGSTQLQFCTFNRGSHASGLG